MLSALFQESDGILLMDSGIDKKPYNPTITQLKDLGGQLQPYYAINPIHPKQNLNDKGAGTLRASINVTAFRNFLFEIDSLPLDVQLSLLRYLAPHIPFAQVTFSGGSSYHAIVSVADTLPFKPHTTEGIAQYSEAWKSLESKLTFLASQYFGGPAPAKLFDSANKDPARLSRTPGAIRPDNQVVQSEVPGFGGYLISDQVLSFMQTHPSTTYKPNSTSMPATTAERGRLAKRTQFFIENWRPELASVMPWHPEFIFAVKDLQSQNFTFDEARMLLTTITGYLDANDIYQMRDVWARQNFRLDFRPVNK